MRRGGAVPNTSPRPTVQENLAPINIYFEGNVMSEEYITDTAIPKIREAIRKGSVLF